MESDFQFSTWSEYFGLNKNTCTRLVKDNLNSCQALLRVNEDELAALGLAVSQFKALRAGVDSLRLRYGDLASKQTRVQESPLHGARNHLKSLLSQQQDEETGSDGEISEISAEVASRLSVPSMTTFDPRAILIVKAKSVKALQIVDFLPVDVKRRLRPKNYKIGAQNASNACIITQDEDSTAYNISVDEWGAANCRLMNELLTSGNLAREDVEYYLAYTTKIFDFAGRFTWSSIMQFDRQYREVQAEFNMQWGMYAPQLEYQVLQPKAATNLTQQTRSAARRGPQEECRNYKARGWCAFGNDCKYKHGPATSEDSANVQPASKGKNG
jgi:hypothetical protein